MVNPDTSPYRSQIRALRRRLQSVIEGGMGIDGYTLMQRAGQCAFEALLQLADTQGTSVVCGSNNAGDGYVVARIALQFGLAVQVSAVADP